MARSLIVSETQNIFKLENYGCWCYADLESMISLGAGKPQDEFDEACKALHENYECLRMDTGDDGDFCFPETTKYSIKQLNIKKTAEQICNESKQGMNDCQYYTCLIELTYVLDVFKLYMGRVYPDPKLRGGRFFDDFDSNSLAHAILG